MDSKLFLEIRCAIGIIQVYVTIHERTVRQEITSQHGGARIQQHGPSLLLQELGPPGIKYCLIVPLLIILSQIRYVSVTLFVLW